MVDLARSAIFVEDNRAVPLGVGDELPPASGDESAGDILQGAPDRIASGPQLAAIRDVQVTGARFEANIEGRDGLHGGYRPDPAPVGRTGDGSGDGTGTEGSTVRVGTQRYGRATERAQRSLAPASPCRRARPLGA